MILTSILFEWKLGDDENDDNDDAQHCQRRRFYWLCEHKSQEGQTYLTRVTLIHHHKLEYPGSICMPGVIWSTFNHGAESLG